MTDTCRLAIQCRGRYRLGLLVVDRPDRGPPDRPQEDHTDVAVETDRAAVGGSARRGAPETPHQPPRWSILDAGKSIHRDQLALAGQPVQVLIRLRSNRVFHTAPEPRRQATAGRPSVTAGGSRAPTRTSRHVPDYETARTPNATGV